MGTHGTLNTGRAVTRDRTDDPADGRRVRLVDVDSFDVLDALGEAVDAGTIDADGFARYAAALGWVEA